MKEEAEKVENRGGGKRERQAIWKEKANPMATNVTATAKTTTTNDVDNKRQDQEECGIEIILHILLSQMKNVYVKRYNKNEAERKKFIERLLHRHSLLKNLTACSQCFVLY